MREHRYTLVFMLDSAALNTTKFMMPGGVANARVREDAHEWTLRHDRCAGFGPGNKGDDDGEGQDVEQKQSQRHAAQRRGIVRTGSLASPEVTAMTSMPLNDKIPKITAIQTPPNPCGMKPPGSPVKIVETDRLRPQPKDGRDPQQ